MTLYKFQSLMRPLSCEQASSNLVEDKRSWEREYSQHRIPAQSQLQLLMVSEATLDSPGPISILFFFLFLILFNLTLQYCIGFAIYQNEPATGIHVFPILNPPSSSLPIPSLWVVPVHQPQASSIRVTSPGSMHETGDLFLTLEVKSMAV